MICTHEALLTPRMTGMTREQIVDAVCNLDPRGEEWHRRRAVDHPCEWPIIVREYTDEFIFAYGEERHLVNTSTTIRWENIT